MASKKQNRHLMRQDYLITVSDYRETRHFTLSQQVRRVLAAAAIGLGLIVLTGAAGIYLLTHKVGDLGQQVSQLDAQRQSVESEKQRLAADRDALRDEVDRRKRELATLSLEVARIESLVGLEVESDRPLVHRVNTAGQTAFEKHVMLRSIPSGFPVASEKVTSRYGMRLHPIKERDAMHNGVDLRAPHGTPIHATADGVVEWASHHRASGLGNMVKLVHNYGFSTTYGHLDRIEVESGTYVKRGTLLGYSGSTGASTAAHLHYEVRYLERQLNPSPFMEWSLEEFDALFTEEDRVQWESLVEVVRTTTSVPERPSLQQAQSLSATLP